MNIFQRVTMQSLKRNRTRTIVTIIGIMLSAALICAVTTTVSSIMNYALENTIYLDGSWHGSELGASYADCVNYAEDDRVDEIVCGQYIGYAQPQESRNEYKPYLYVMGAGDGFFDMMPVHLIAGEYPDADDELLLPAHLAENGGIVYKLGDTISLELGDRIIDGEVEYPAYQNTPAYYYSADEEGYYGEALNNEELRIREARTYRVVGFYERPEFEDRTAPGYTALTIADEDIDGGAHCDLYFTMKHAEDVYAFMEDNAISSATNTDLLMFSGVSRYDGFGSMLAGLATVVIVLIMFGSVSLIYNAFSISVSERTKQFGLLSSIGATRRQLRHMVFYEALVVSAIGIPLGIVVGIVGIGITLLLIGDRFVAVSGLPIPMHICVSPAAILIACIVALITVLISAWIPSRRATRITAVEAIRQSQDIRTKNKRIRTPKLVYKLFGLPGMMAQKQFKRNRRKYRATVVSLSMSIILFVTSSAFTSYLTESAEGSFDTAGYDLRYSMGTGDDTNPEELLKLLRSDPFVESISYHYERGIYSYLSTGDTTDDASAQIEKENPPGSDEAMAKIFTVVYFVDDAVFRTLLQENHLREEDFMNAENPLALVYERRTWFDAERERYTTINFLNKDRCTLTAYCNKEYDGYALDGYTTDDATGETYCVYVSETDPEDTFQLREEEVLIPVSMSTGKRLDSRPYFVGQYDCLSILYPVSLMDAVFAESEADLRSSLYYDIIASEHKSCENSLKQLLMTNGLSTDALYNYAEEAEQTRSIILIIKVFTYGFIVLISLIAAANVFNTISTNIILRRREFAMLKSVGMTDGGLRRMLCYECLLYGARALLFGLPVAAVMTYFIYLSIMEGFETVYRLPLDAIGVAVLSVFLVVFATMLYSMSKVRRDNPIDALKNENL